jgi:hypothetical protein
LSSPAGLGVETRCERQYVAHAVIHIPNIVDDRWLPSRKASPRSTAMAVPNVPPFFINGIKHWQVEYR